MSLTSSDFAKAKTEILASGADPADMLEALVVIERQRQQIAALERNAAWACGRKGDGALKVNGLSDTLTQLLRRFAACGMVRYEDFSDLHRHVSALRKRLTELGPTIEIVTVIGEGYELTKGYDEVYRLLRSGAEPTLRAPGFTVKQTAILSLLANRGSAHVDQINCLQRHMSNIRAKLKAAGLERQVVIVTQSGEGLYSVDKGRDVLARLVAGEMVAPAKPSKPKALPKRKPEPVRLAA